MNRERHDTDDMARTMAAAGSPVPREAPPREADNPPQDERHIDERRLDDRSVPMFAGDEAMGFRTQWDAIQTGFVDEPRRAVEQADALVSQVIKRLSEVFAEERSTLEHQWGRGDQISTEDLRMALRKYRSFFERLLSL